MADFIDGMPIMWAHEATHLTSLRRGITKELLLSRVCFYLIYDFGLMPNTSWSRFLITENTKAKLRALWLHRPEDFGLQDVWFYKAENANIIFQTVHVNGDHGHDHRLHWDELTQRTQKFVRPGFRPVLLTIPLLISVRCGFLSALLPFCLSS